MNTGRFERQGEHTWVLPKQGPMHVPGVIYATEELLVEMDDKVAEQVSNVASLPGIVEASYAMPDAHWGYGFPIGGVAAFDAGQGGVVSAGGVGFDISCGVRCLRTGLKTAAVRKQQQPLANELARAIPAGVGSTGRLRLGQGEMRAMLAGGARWAVEHGHGDEADLAFVEEQGAMAGAEPDAVSDHARKRMTDQVGTLGSGNHYLEVQRVATVHDEALGAGLGLAQDDVVVSIHCGSRGLGHQIGTEFLKRMAVEAKKHGIHLPDRELACAPLRSDTGRHYLGAMRAAINCALANRQVLTAITRKSFAQVLPEAELPLLYDVSHNTCKEETHEVDGVQRTLFVHRKGATRAFGPGHPDLPEAYAQTGQPVFIGGSMGTASYILVGCESGMEAAFGSACHGAGRRMSRNQARKTWHGRSVVNELADRGILIRSPSMRGVAEEAPGAYKDVSEVVEAAEQAGLAKRVARLEPLVCVKG